MKDASETTSVQQSLRHPGRWLWLFLLVPAVLGLMRLRFDVEIFDLLPSDLAVVKGLKLYEEHFANARELIITIKAKDAEQGENAARALAQRLKQRTDLASSVLWEPPWLEHPEQAAELLAYLWFNQPPSVFQELSNHLAPERLAENLAATREELATSMSPQELGRMSYDPFGLMRLPEGAVEAAPSFGQGQEAFSSQDGTFRIVFVQAERELRTYRECERWLNQIRKLAGTLLSERNFADVAFGYTGRPAFVAEISRGMERDITTSVGGTGVIIAILFWLAHKRVKPMLWLLTLLALILICTLALGGLVFGAINVVSMGFAAILLGLAVDYAVVHYQEALAHPGLTIPQIRHAIAPSIFWAAITTISAFLVLNLGGLPGLRQLGTLVALGVTLAAVIMIFEFLPPLFPERSERSARFRDSRPMDMGAAPEHRRSLPGAASSLWELMRLGITVAIFVITLSVLGFGLPRIDPTADALRPRASTAYSAMEEVQTRLARNKEPLWLVMSGHSVSEVAASLEKVQSLLTEAVSNQLIAGFSLPTALWPRPEFQVQNRATAGHLVSERGLLREAASTNGFSESALGLTQSMINTWAVASESQSAFWPTNPMSRWIFEKIAAHTPTNYLALGLITSLKGESGDRHRRLANLESRLPYNVSLSGWELLGSSIFSRVRANMWKVLTPMVLLVSLSLFLAFRRLAEIALSLAVLLLSALCLLAVMRLFGWSWNLLNLMAIPLVLGTGVDYSIFMQLALRRHHGDLQLAYDSVGRALLLCGGTAIAGFGSLAWSSNAGMASLGQVCAVGIGSNMLIAIFLLPVWWQRLTVRRLVFERSAQESQLCDGLPSSPGASSSSGTSEGILCATGVSSVATPGDRHMSEKGLATPSSLYRAEFWMLGMWIVRLFPQGVCHLLGRFFAKTYWSLAKHRREVVIENLLPPLKGDAEAAERTAKVLFNQFAIKVIDLWRFEAGLSIDSLFGTTTGWEHFRRAQAEKRGVLLLTPHLGNWEFGGPLLTQRGVTLQVITLAEPGQKFTELRQASRARWNIETLVIRDDPLAFVEIIRKLESGATIALLIDRPPAPTAINVQLFGRLLPASIAAAELARASGCALLPVFLPRKASNYEAHILPPIPYERAALREREARQKLTQRIMGVFEPIIRENLEQWYHFVPIWPDQRSVARTSSSAS